VCCLLIFRVQSLFKQNNSKPTKLIKLTTHTVCAATCQIMHQNPIRLYRAMHYHIEAQLEPQQNNCEQPRTRSPASHSLIGSLPCRVLFLVRSYRKVRTNQNTRTNECGTTHSKVQLESVSHHTWTWIWTWTWGIVRSGKAAHRVRQPLVAEDNLSISGHTPQSPSAYKASWT
jgi:hypothetical protein